MEYELRVESYFVLDELDVLEKGLDHIVFTYVNGKVENVKASGSNYDANLEYLDSDSIDEIIVVRDLLQPNMKIYNIKDNDGSGPFDSEIDSVTISYTDGKLEYVLLEKNAVSENDLKFSIDEKDTDIDELLKQDPEIKYESKKVTDKSQLNEILKYLGL